MGIEFLALPILLFFIFAVISFTTKPHLAVALILLISIVNAWFIEPPSVKLGLNVFLFDLVFVPLLFSAFYRIIFKYEWHNTSWLWVGYGLILFYGLLIGIKQYGTSAGVDFRGLFYYWSGTLYFMTFPYAKEILDKIMKYWLIVCSLLLLIVYFRFVADFLHLPISATWIAVDSTIRFRVVNSSHAYLLGTVVLMLFHRYVMPDAIKPSRLQAIFFIVAVIVLQHRSVWVATSVGILTLFLLPGIKMHKIAGKLVILGALGIALLLPLFLAGHLDNILDSISGSAEKASNLNTGTFGARRKAWERIMQYWPKQDFLKQLLGEPFGGDYAGLPNSPHNFFFQSLLRTGMLGNLFIYTYFLGILIKLYLILLQRRNDHYYPVLFFIIVTGQMVFYIPYAPQPEHGILLGIAASLSKRGITTGNSEAIKQSGQYFLKTPNSSNFKHIQTQIISS